jgi:hypothetical protein
MSAPGAAQEEYVKDNDYTLSVNQTEEKVLARTAYPLTATSSITRTFNFLSQQITTTTRDYIYQPAAHNYGGSSGVSVTTTIQNFRDIQSPEEIARMHARLLDMDGHPPDLDNVLKNDLPLAKPRLKGL